MQLTTIHDSIPSSLRIPITSADGLTVSVPLHGSLDSAIVDCDDFKKLQDIGLTDQWRLEKVRGYLSAKQEQAIYAVRMIAGARLRMSWMASGSPWRSWRKRAVSYPASAPPRPAPTCRSHRTQNIGGGRISGGGSIGGAGGCSSGSSGGSPLGLRTGSGGASGGGFGIWAKRSIEQLYLSGRGEIICNASSGDRVRRRRIGRPPGRGGGTMMPRKRQ